jgi:hypothetical protein
MSRYCRTITLTDSSLYFGKRLGAIQTGSTLTLCRADVTVGRRAPAVVGKSGVHEGGCVRRYRCLARLKCPPILSKPSPSPSALPLAHLIFNRSKTSGAESRCLADMLKAPYRQHRRAILHHITAVHGMVGVQCSNAYLERLRSKWLDAELLFRCRSGAEQRLELIN